MRLIYVRHGDKSVSFQTPMQWSLFAMRILFAVSEAFPLVKTGGLADVAGALPAALAAQGVDVRLMLPAYPACLDGALNKRDGLVLGDLLGLGETRLIEAEMPDTGVKLLLVDNAGLYRRGGGPYQDAGGRDWADNDRRFAVLSMAAARVAIGGANRAWRPDILHAHDWQTGLAAAYLKLARVPAVKTVFTIHNLQYRGLFGADALPGLDLPQHAFGLDGVEFHGDVSLLKAGLVYADEITTVSPTYAREIQTAEGGCGLDGLLRHRGANLSGLINGVDYGYWAPEVDVFLRHRYGAADLSGKAREKAALAADLGLEGGERPLIGVVSRLTDQKGIDLVIAAAPALVAEGAEIAILGSGDAHLEAALDDLVRRHRGIAFWRGYDEPLAHRIIAGSDLFAMPSRFEPCGLTQMYAMRYGTPPVVRRTGGLADTVRDAGGYEGDGSGAEETGTGFVFDEPRAEALLSALRRGIALHREPARWQRLQRRAMAEDFGWPRAAAAYRDLYDSLFVRAW